MKVSWNNFAPRLGAIYRLNEKTVIRTGYGVTYNATPWARAVRGDNDYPITLASASPNVDPFGFYNTLQQGVPTIVAPDQSSGRIPLDRDRGRVHAGNRQHRSRLRPDLERRVRAPPAVRHRRWTSPTSVRRAPTAMPHSTSTRRRCSAAAIAGASVLHRSGAILRINSWGDRLKTKYQSLQVALNKPFTHGLLFKGAYTFSKSMNESDNDGRADAELEHAQRALAQLGAGRLRSPAQLPAWLRVCSCRGRATEQLRRRREGDHQRLADERRAWRRSAARRSR